VLQVRDDVLENVLQAVQRPEVLQLHAERLLAVLISVRPLPARALNLLALPCAGADHLVDEHEALLHGT
jgi:hypothetical protein